MDEIVGVAASEAIIGKHQCLIAEGGGPKLLEDLFGQVADQELAERCSNLSVLLEREHGDLPSEDVRNASGFG